MLSMVELRFLSLNERAQYVWNNGRFITSRITGVYRTNIYWLGSYYVEVVINSKSNQIIDVVPKQGSQHN
jgi:hypothetical protein